MIRNDTKWPLQLSLEQVGPLYYDVVKPGATFYRDTGAVWFTVKAKILLDPSKEIKLKDAVLPIAETVVAVLVAAGTAGFGAWLAPAAAGAGAIGAAGSITYAGLTSAVMETLIGAGLTAETAIVAGTAVTAGVVAAGTTAVTQAALTNAFSKENASVSKAGCYAGPPWPFRQEMPLWTISGGPVFTPAKTPEGKDVSGLSASPLVINT
ncbi:hypothetical protein HYH03_005047 [Edaphochlamys debaryana]|uniref:Uncharacterized protein n=1 Tax=Edaphochlamys debaryana TaxID=47281 RepID=A0A835Y950_9CHLO|nr:hypothetical protein HYH03_005047 [Edaphochlamys debaryana]|eukprot:KAG2497048.1 hypothetical protein HYH03_005047 [Edaphochlamys debaryana]